MAGYPNRASVSDPYQPPEFTHAVVEAGPVWADPPSPPPGLGQRVTLCSGEAKTLEEAGLIGPDGRPTNPLGRTGIKGRGLLGKWGPNMAADTLLTRFHPSDPGLVQAALIKRKDTGQWAIPGGMTEGKSVAETVLAEFKEEALGALDRSLHPELLSRLDSLFARGGKRVYAGVVGSDPRNTDNAWMETVVMWFHVNDQLLKQMPLRAGDDAVGAKWVTLTQDMDLYANHGEFVRMVLQAIERRPKTRSFVG